MPKHSTRGASPARSVSPTPMPAKTRSRRAAAAAAAASAETAHSSALEVSPKKKSKKEKLSEPGSPVKKGGKKKHEYVDDVADDVADDVDDVDDVDFDADADADDAAKDDVKYETITVEIPVELPERAVPDADNAAPSAWRLPGALSPYVDDTTEALQEAVFFAFTSTALSSATRHGVTQHAISSASFTDSTGWGALLRASSVQSYGSLAALAFTRLVKHVVGWDDIYAISALNVLVSAPIVYLLSVFYDVPLSASILSEVIEFASDVLPVVAYKKWIRPSPMAGETKTAPLEPVHDPISRPLLVAFSSVLYNFMVVQACRAYLPGALVLHFSGISTVEPARAHPLTWGSLFSQNSIWFALFQSPSVVAVSTVCAYAAWVYIFERLDNPTGAEGLAAWKPIGMRSLAASITVGLGVFVRCFTGIYSVDATGAALFDIVWTLSPLVVGSILGYIISF